MNCSSYGFLTLFLLRQFAESTSKSGPAIGNNLHLYNIHDCQLEHGCNQLLSDNFST